MKVGFEGVYDEPLYRNLKSSSRDTLISNFLSHFNYVLRNNNESWLHYVMNHDDSFPLASDHFLAWFCLTSLLPGWLLIYNGSLWGRVKRLSHHWVDLLSDKYLNLDALPEFYRAWFRWIRDENPQITQVEEMTSIVKLTWQGNNTRGLVYFNLSGTSQDGFAAYKNIIFTSNMSASLFEPYQVVVTM